MLKLNKAKPQLPKRGKIHSEAFLLLFKLNGLKVQGGSSTAVLKTGVRDA
jgi:hypothetical protein